jgi:hypothetical protein
LTKSKTDIADPKRAKLLRDNEEARCVESITERENSDPNRAMPNTDTAEPKRAKPLSDKDAPRCKKSMTDTEDPTREKDLIDKVEPR